MATTPPPVSQPVPLPVTRSPEKPTADLRHPMPDLQSLQGAYVGNIERLEERAERMSEAGSDLGEEIRKLHSELKRSDSRRSSIRSGNAFEETPRPITTRSRNVSTSSHANSIVDVNGTARWGGYSPGGYVTSPGGSLRSGSMTNPTTSIQRARSGSRASRLGQIVRPEEVVDEKANSETDPTSPRSAPLALHNSNSPPPQDTRKVSSFTRKYDAIAQELRDELRNSVHLDQPPHHDDNEHHEDNQQHSEQYQYQYGNHHDYPDRPPTAASTDTTRQARTLWQDFDGVHCPDTVPEEEPTPSHSRQSSYHSMMKSSLDAPPQGAPPPDDGMVFYPAPVPKMLNLPKRLSQLPASSVQARRRTQLLDSMQAEHRKSAPMLGDLVDGPKPKENRKSIAALPPQLRASAYFDQVASPQEFAVKGESAEDTLDSILDASARAPVSAFTDHPFAGHVGSEIYGPEHKRKSSKLPDMPPKLEETKRRSSFIMLDTKHNSNGEPLNKLKKRNSSADMNLLILKSSESRMSLGDELDVHDEHARGPADQGEHTPTRRSYDQEGRNPDDVYDEEHMDDEEHEELEPEEEPQIYGAPTTLLAELQLRKAQQKTRNMNYATLVEQGNMPTHRTLLQLDDMAEKEKQKRMRKKVNLAWEAQPEEDSSDDDVPLGVLYKQPNQQKDWDRPIGLIAQRELEDHEPLSRRRARLRGDDSGRPQTLRPTASQQFLNAPTATTPGAESEEEIEGETLGERMRRLREKKELEAALGDDIRKSTVSTDFATEMLSKLGVSDEKEKDAPKPETSLGAEEEETLGQRRARLQAEAAARGDTATRPGLHSSFSLADVLSANPVDTNNQARKVSDSQLVSHLPPGSLLHQNVLAEERKKASRLTQNMRASSYGAHDPLLRNVGPEKSDEDTPLALKIQAYKNKMAGVGTTPSPGMPTNMPNMSRQPSMMNMPMSMSMSMMQPPPFQYPQHQQSPLPGSQSMMSLPMGMQMGMGMGMMPMNNMNSMNGMNGMGMQMPMGMPMNGMQMQMGMPMQMGGGGMMMPPMDPRQRDNIDKWMQGIGH